MRHYKKFKGYVFFKYLNIKKIMRGFMGRKFYHIIGDSHALNFLHEAFIIHHIGPATAFKLNSEKSTTKSREKAINILNKIYKEKPMNVIFVFGELDARIHINKIANQKHKDVDRVIGETVKSYMTFLNFVKGKYPLISIYVFNVLPQGEEKNIYNYPFYAEREKRSLIAKKMNDKLRDFSNKNHFKFVYIYDKLIDKNGERLRKFVFDDVHFNRKIMPYVIESLETIEKE